jgi:hypothetical protein
MSRLISDILEAPEPAFSHMVQEWERLSGRPAIDVRLSTEVINSTASLVKLLGLDPKDTTSREFYYALNKKALEDERLLSGHLGIGQSDTPVQLVKKVIKFVDGLPVPRDVWVAKASVIKPLLKSLPPKKLMKVCGYRSIDSVLKRTSVGELLCFAPFVESRETMLKFYAKYKRFTPSDFGLQRSLLQLADAKDVEKMRSEGYLKHHLVLPSYELGSVVVVPAEKRFEGDVLSFVTAILESLRMLRMYSAYFRVISVLPTFGSGVMQSLEYGLAPASRLLLNTDWSHIHAIKNRNNSHILEQHQPHLQLEDLEAPSSATILGEALPMLALWKQHQYAGKTGTQSEAVSPHLFDVAINLSNTTPFERRTILAGRHALADELYGRYLEHEPVARVHLKWYDLA